MSQKIRNFCIIAHPAYAKASAGFATLIFLARLRRIGA